ncbi:MULTISPECIES: flagellar hook-basal body complex protein [unclassified Marinomonas]|jgi:flagellar hook protein FlgE|uniref:flagellar hook-basal body complex protein n=1 Tax=unclassified Marinomonas TaxID=196814 RepID=UPI0037CB4B47
MGFNTALSGIKASADYLSVTGNNIANADTTGFKKSRIEFNDLYNSNVLGAGSSNVIGSGVSVASVSQEFSSGNLAYTDNNLDLAVDGTGFFVLDAGAGTQAYTRAGEFKLNADGNLVTNAGSKVQGYNAVDGIIGGNLEDMVVPTARIPPKATSSVELKVNLNSEGEDVPPYIRADFDPANPDTYDYTQTQTVADGNGNNHLISYYYAKSKMPNTYEVYATVDGKSTDDTGAPFMQPTYATFNGAEASDYNGDGVDEPPFSLLYSGAAEPTVTDIANLTKNPIAAGGTLNGVAIAGTLDPTLVRTPDNIARPAFDPKDPSSYSYGNTKNVYDALGETHTLGYYFIQQGEDNTYELRATVDGKESYIDPTTGEDKRYLDKDTVVTFDPAGNLSGAYKGIPPFGSSQPVQLQIQGFDPTNRNSIIPVDLTGSTQFALDSTDELKQDGFSAGELQGVSFDEDGNLIATYTNQQTATLGQLALATFDNTDGLVPDGDTAWVAGKDSGPASVGRPNSGTLGSVQGGALEESNVDLTSELVALIEAQRNYQANSKTLETENTVTQTIINLR